MDKKTQSLGEYKVGVTFNPSKNHLVDDIKRKTAELIDLLDGYSIDKPEICEATRLISLAKTDYENASMWAVKAVTKQPIDL